MEPGSFTGPPALSWLTKDAMPKDSNASGLKNLAFWAFQAPFSASGLDTTQMNILKAKLIDFEGASGDQG